MYVQRHNVMACVCTCLCTECQMIAHVECRDLSPIPCIPSPVTPTKKPTVVCLLLHIDISHACTNEMMIIRQTGTSRVV